MRTVDIYVSSRAGLVRPNNEDIVLAGHGLYRDADWSARGIVLSDTDRYAAAVCDGMGGHNAGEVASEDVARQLGRLTGILRPGMDFDALRAAVGAWHRDEHAYLVQLGQDDPKLAGMGTTLAAWLYYEGTVCWAGCGDSRVYRMRGGALAQLSRDHNMRAVTHNPADSHIMYNCMGGDAPDTFLDMEDITASLAPGDLYLICSDGLPDMLPDTLIEQTLAAGGRAAQLTDAACRAGGADNVSACVVELR